MSAPTLAPTSDAELLDHIDATLIGLLALSYFGPAEQRTAESVRQACASEVLLARLRATRRAVAELRDALGIKTPARQYHSAGLVPAGGPVQPSEPLSEKEPVPGSAAAVSGAACGSGEVSQHLDAGASSVTVEKPRRPVRVSEDGTAADTVSGREKSARPEGGAPGEPPPPAVAPDVPDVRARDDGRAGNGAPGAATQTRTEDERGFSLPTFTLPSFGTP